MSFIMLIDGRALAEAVYATLRTEVAARATAPHLTIFTCAPDMPTQQYLALKKRRAADVGVSVNVIEVPECITTEEMVTTVTQAQMQTDGIIVQLPLPKHLNTAEVLNAISTQYDVDGMHYDGTAATMMSPVVAAIALMCAHHDILLATQQVVVVGDGRLVGQPAAVWAQKQGAHVTVITKDTSQAEAAAVIAHADVLILGAGQAGLVTPEMVKDGVIIFDAGTSEDGGELKGDADPAVAKKASLMTPVPGGIGPLTVACLLRNLIDLTSRQ
jgi:methylenetetrahydrofolate dehydrogenase (NADP+)/methenyltetrahydrofolate cyclohydrolase